MSLAALPLWAGVYVTAVAFGLGCILGSAGNCLAWRIARSQPWARGRSQCPQCRHVLGARDLVPVLSWLFLRGRCRYCGAPISVRYPLTELCLGAVFAAVTLRFGLSLQTLTGFALCFCLLCLSLVDLEVQLIPDRFLLIPALVRLAQLAYEGGLAGLWRGAVPALVLGGGVLALVLVMDKVLGRESMGGGDIKLLAMLGLWFSLPCCLLLLLGACLFGLGFAAVLARMERSVPFAFGPAISAAAVCVLLWGEPVVAWYLGLFA